MTTHVINKKTLELTTIDFADVQDVFFDFDERLIALGYDGELYYVLLDKEFLKD